MENALYRSSTTSVGILVLKLLPVLLLKTEYKQLLWWIHNFDGGGRTRDAKTLEEHSADTITNFYG